MKKARTTDDASARRTEGPQQALVTRHAEEGAIHKIADAFNALKALGWREAIYCPKGSSVELIEAGCTVAHRGYRDEIGFWIPEDGDIYPSRPILFRPLPGA